MCQRPYLKFLLCPFACLFYCGNANYDLHQRARYHIFETFGSVRSFWELNHGVPARERTDGADADGDGDGDG